ncbi:MAG: ABC transporter substrate-binding protein [bacterium]
MIPHIRAARSAVVLAVALSLGACAPSHRFAPGAPTSAPGGEVEGPAAPATGGQDVDAQTNALRSRLAEAPPAEASSMRLRLARTLEAAGRDTSSLVEYAWITGSATKPGDAAAAWDGIARLSRRAGDEAQAVRAEAEAYDAADPAERARRESALRASSAKLDAPSARRLARQTRGTPAGAVLAREDAPRRSDAEIVVALLLPLTGRFESFGKAFQLGAEVALGQRNAAAPSARPVRLVVEDTADELLDATKAARAAILDEDATVLIGPLLSVPALGAGAIAEAFGIPLIAPTATDPDLRRVGPHVLTLDPSARELAEPLAHVAVDVLGGKRFGALVAREAAAEEREREFGAAVERRGGQIALSVAYDPGERDFRKSLDLLRDAAVDAVYVPGDASELEALVPQLEFYDFDRRILGHGGWTSPRVRTPGTHTLEGCVLSVEAADDPGSAFAKRLADAVQRKEGAEPTRFHVRGCQVMEAVLFALDRGATDPEALATALRLREAWSERPEGEEIRMLTVREGSLVPADPENLLIENKPAAAPDSSGGTAPSPSGG